MKGVYQLMHAIYYCTMRSSPRACTLVLFIWHIFRRVMPLLWVNLSIVCILYIDNLATQLVHWSLHNFWTQVLNIYIPAWLTARIDWTDSSTFISLYVISTEKWLKYTLARIEWDWKRLCFSISVVRIVWNCSFPLTNADDGFTSIHSSYATNIFPVHCCWGGVRMCHSYMDGLCCTWSNGCCGSFCSFNHLYLYWRNWFYYGYGATKDGKKANEGHLVLGNHIHHSWIPHRFTW